MPKQHRYFALFILGICTFTLVVACDFSPKSPISDRAKSPNSESCRIVQHERGKTEVCGQPQKVAALSPHILDSMLALGVQPAAYAEAANLNQQIFDQPEEQIPYIGKWVTTQPIALGDRKSPSLERLTQLKPDLILGEDWLGGDSYQLLSRIAPTLLFSDEQADGTHVWQQDIEGIAKALDREDKVQELQEAYRQKIAATRTALKPILEQDPRVLILNSNLIDHISIIPDSTAGRLIQEIGFKVVRPEGIKTNTRVSFEAIPSIEADIILVFAWSDDQKHFFNPEKLAQMKWKANPLLSSMPASQANRVYFVDYQLWGSNIRGPLADQLILDALPDLLLNSVRKT